MAQGELFDSSLCIHTIVDRTFLIVSRTHPNAYKASGLGVETLRSGRSD
jgi:hypothetical protein